VEREILTRQAVAHAIVDALERVGGLQDYYRLNHAHPEQLEELADLVSSWCRRVGIPIDPDPPGHG